MVEVKSGVSIGRRPLLESTNPLPARFRQSESQHVYLNRVSATYVVEECFCSLAPLTKVHVTRTTTEHFAEDLLRVDFAALLRSFHTIFTDFIIKCPGVWVRKDVVGLAGMSSAKG